MKKISIITLGCKVNQYESDALGEVLENMGYEISHKLEIADIFILNSCAVTNEAEKKSRQMIAKFNRLNPKCKIYICGCASQNNSEQFLKLPNVKYVVGNANPLLLTEKIGKSGKNIGKLPEEYSDFGITKATNRRAYIKIQDGCSRYCSYCLIPYLRGKSRSRDMLSVLKEASTLIKNGAKEIVVTGVDISDYKIDDKPALFDLLVELDKFGVRYRLGSIEPNLLTEEFVKEIAKLKRICPHFHISMQSGATATLARMNRHYTSKFFIERVKLLRKYFKNPAITTDIIVGFPGESDAEFAESVKTISKIKFAHTHIFPYSRRSGTNADKLLALKSNSEFFEINGATIKARVQKLLEINQKNSKKYLKLQKNKILEVIIEEFDGEFYKGTSANYVTVYIKSDENLTNKTIMAKITKNLYKDGVLGELKI